MQQSKERKFFSRFNKIISLAYGAVTISAVVLFSFLYNDNYRANIQNINLRLREQESAFDNVLRLRYDTVKNMQKQARKFLRDELLLFNTNVRLNNDLSRGIYYLDHPSLGNQSDNHGMIVGLGNSSTLDHDTLHELQMTFSLLPLVTVLKNSAQSLTSFHYTSENKFCFSFPWDHKQEINFNKNIYEKKYYQLSLPENNPAEKVVWSDVFIKEDNLMVTCAAPVYKGIEFKGVVGFDFTLDVVDFFVESLHYPAGNFIVVNDYDTVIANLCNKGKKHSITKLRDILPKNLPHKYVTKISNATLTKYGDYWIFVAKASFAPWRIIYYIKNSDITIVTIKHVLPSLLLILLFTTIFLIGANRLVAREFIYPTSILITHITNQGRTNHADLSNISSSWHEWFKAISEVFEDNRELVEKLEKHIDLLDDKVKKRTADLSEKNKQLEKAIKDLKKAQTQIITQEKLAELGILTAGIAHEMRNPLNFIINFAETSKMFSNEIVQEIERLPDSLDQQSTDLIKELSNLLLNNMNKIEEHGKRADAIVRSMLNHARGEADSFCKEDIHNVLDENILLGITAFKAKGFSPSIVKNYDQTIGQVNICPQDLGRVFLNLIHNSCYALLEKLQKKGSIFTPELSIITKNESSDFTVIIRDNGMGMSPDIKKKVFNPFFTTKPSGEGTGLGLSLGFDIIVKQHQGNIELDTKEDEYTEFKITIPKNI